MEGRFAVWIPVKGVEEVMPMVRELRETRLVQGIDFDFSYQAGRFDWGQDAQVERRGVTFFMRDEKWATFLRIKYSNEINQSLPGF